jgi:isopentenyldiphosphate isomerase
MAAWYDVSVDPSSDSAPDDPPDQPPGARPGEELVEHVDVDGTVIEVVPRSRMRAENLRHRSVAIILQASDGRLLVHRRADHKDVYPGWWDVAAGGVVGAGEPSDLAAERELAEEVGVTGAALEFVTESRFDDDHAKEICRVYRVVCDGPYRFDDGEVAEARLVDADALAALMATERFLPGSVAMLLPLLGGAFAGAAARADALRCRPVQRVEFTVEPFVEGQPGPHVTAPLEAIRARGLEVEFGPFGSEFITPTALTPAVVAAILDAAFANGATHVTIDVAGVDATAEIPRPELDG